MARQVRRRCHHRPAEPPQQVARDRVGGNADRDGVEPGGGQIGDRAALGFRQHQRQRARPERLGQPGRLRIEMRQVPGGGEIADMSDQRIEGRPALGLDRAARPRRDWSRRRRGHTPSRSGNRPAHPAPDNAPPPPSRPRRRAKSAFSGPHGQQLRSSIWLLAVSETQGYKPRSCRSVAQPGRALRSGRRGRRFESCHSDQ